MSGIREVRDLVSSREAPYLIQGDFCILVLCKVSKRMQKCATRHVIVYTNETRDSIRVPEMISRIGWVGSSDETKEIGLGP